jgi:hypothetical protein
VEVVYALGRRARRRVSGAFLTPEARQPKVAVSTFRLDKILA